ncbi:MAG: HisA/HisF-related TIM barrel protein, partial [Methylovulum sp.]|nr:HisA/HisF-related TIM barrel protein [Methylovulum sp.]
AYDNYLPVLGSESYSTATLKGLTAFDKRFVLSLDYAPSGVALGAAELFAEGNYWPQDIIIMTLAQVGSGLGPDWARLKAYCAAYPGYNFIAAGGVRHLADLQTLSDMGVRCALVASALHSGVIGRGELLSLRQKNTPAN